MQAYLAHAVLAMRRSWSSMVVELAVETALRDTHAYMSL